MVCNHGVGSSSLPRSTSNLPDITRFVAESAADWRGGLGRDYPFDNTTPKSGAAISLRDHLPSLCYRRDTSELCPICICGSQWNSDRPERCPDPGRASRSA